MRVLLLCVVAFVVGLLAGALFWTRGDTAWERVRTPRESAPAAPPREREPVARRAGGGDVGEFAREEAIEIERAFPRDGTAEEGAITGTVRGPAGEPIAGVIVSAFPTSLPAWLSSPRRRMGNRRHEDFDLGDAARNAIRDELWRRRARHVATSGADGRYEMRVLAKTNYSLTISYSLHAYHERYGVKPVASASDCAPGSVVDFRAQPVVSTTVEVRLPDGQLAKSAWLYWQGPHGSGYHAWAPTLDRVRLPVGSCTVRAQAWAPEPLSGEVDCTLGPNALHPAVVLQLAGRCVLKARLVLPEGLAMPTSVEYRLRRLVGSEEPDPRSLLEDQDARVGSSQTPSLAFWYDLAPGRYFVAASRGRSRVLAHAVVEVGEGLVDVDLEMPDPVADRHLVVKLLGPAGGVATGRTWCRIVTQTAKGPRYHGPDPLRRSDGSLVLPLADMELQGAEEATLRVGVEEYGTVEQDLDLGSSGSITVRFAVPARVRLRVKGYVESGFAGRLYVNLVGERVFPLYGSIQPDGRCQLPGAQPGEYSLQLKLRKQNESWSIAQRKLVLGAGDHEHTMAIPVLHTLRVRPVGHLGRGPVMLRCSDPAIGTFKRHTRPSDGVAVFEELGPGSYEIQCGGRVLAVRVPGPAEVTIE
jgi:hypothetical protein